MAHGGRSLVWDDSQGRALVLGLWRVTDREPWNLELKVKNTEGPWNEHTRINYTLKEIDALGRCVCMCAG